MKTEAQCQKITNTARGLQEVKLRTVGTFDHPYVVPPVEHWEVSQKRTMSQKVQTSAGDVCKAIDVYQEEDVDQDMLYEDEGCAERGPGPPYTSILTLVEEAEARGLDKWQR